MTIRETKIAEVKPPIDPANSMVGSPDTVENKAATGSATSAENDTKNGDTPNAPAFELPRCLSPQQVKERNQRRQIEFPTRTAGLEELANIRSHLAEAAIKYRSNLQALYDDLALICRILDSTLDDPPDSLSYSVDSHELLLKQSALALNGLANVIDIMEPQLKVPVKTTELRGFANHLYFIIDPEGKCCDAVATDQHLAEADLAGSGIWDLKQEIENLKAFVVLSKLPAGDPEREEVEPNRNGTLLKTTPESVAPLCDHSDDFRCVKWFGTGYIFTPGQAGAVKCLWEMWVRRLPAVSSAIIAEAAGGDSKRIRDIFKLSGKKMHPAWETMICKTNQKDTYFLKPPAGHEIPS